MNQMIEIIRKREHFLKDLKHKKLEILKNAPSGSLRICCNGKRIQFYHKTDPGNPSGTYIKQENHTLMKSLAQKDYDQKLIHSIDLELAALEKYQKMMPNHTAEDIYEALHPARQALVSPIQLPDKTYQKNWQAFEYPRKPFTEGTPELYTSNGERVRSKSEIMIADLLHREKIPYRYECPLYLNGYGTIHPDFTLLRIADRKEIYWEHLGIMDDPEYAEKAVQRINAYMQNGIFPGDLLILSFETRYNPLNSKSILYIIQQYL